MNPQKRRLEPLSRWRLVAAAFLIAALALGTGSSGLAERSRVLIKLETSLGEITLELLSDKAPLTVANFVEYVRAGHYDGTIFHRVIDGFMIQGGGLDANLRPKPTREPIKNEADNGLANEAYTVAMARTGEPHSASAQFFINVADNSFLNHTAKTAEGWGYAVFGRVVEGREVVDKIKAVATGRKGFYEDVPRETVAINRAVLIED